MGITSAFSEKENQQVENKLVALLWSEMNHPCFF
jgi:hypothetical protein